MRLSLSYFTKILKYPQSKTVVQWRSIFENGSLFRRNSTGQVEGELQYLEEIQEAAELEDSSALLHEITCSAPAQFNCLRGVQVGWRKEEGYQSKDFETFPKTNFFQG